MQTRHRIVLVGGGHAHVEVLRHFACNPIAHVDLTLISPREFTPYSGMLPGLVAGHYRWRECHIDLKALCAHASATLHLSCATGIDPEARTVTCDDGQIIPYTTLSLDVGSTPSTHVIPGATDFGIGVKPTEPFLARVDRMELESSAPAPRRIVVVGGGAAGVEICLALLHRLERIDMHLVCAAAHILPGHNPMARSLMRKQLRAAGVKVHLSKSLALAEAEELVLSDGSRLPYDEVIWATGSSAPAWLRTSRLALTEDGFLSVDEYLRCVSHPDVFGSGDVATQLAHPRPKSGVFAVRQGPILARNLQCMATGNDPLAYLPQRRTLALISTGPRHAIASWGPVALAGDWVWRWKDHIDRTFMRRYELPHNVPHTS